MPKISSDTTKGMFAIIDIRLTNQDKVLEGIHDQTKKTNGSVAEIQAWKNQIMGGLILLVIIFVPVALYIIYKLIDYLFVK